jgi:hypothetical protein
VKILYTSLVFCVVATVGNVAFSKAASSPWPENAPKPSLHYDCGKAVGQVLVRVQVAEYVTKDYVLVWNPT